LNHGLRGGAFSAADVGCKAYPTGTSIMSTVCMGYTGVYEAIPVRKYRETYYGPVIEYLGRLDKWLHEPLQRIPVCKYL